MAEFRLNQPITTQDAKVEVSVTREQPLAVGKHRFRLIVVDQAGNESVPDEIEVVVLDNERPTAILEGPKTINFGQAFVLNGDKSSDPNGPITQYRWELIESPNRDDR